jgi:DNA processing protein
VAVLGCGLDIDYPRRSRPLAEAIAERGCMLSEFALGAEPRPWHFPVRNRVIAALSTGTLVVQAAPRSGSLVTAHLALDLGREVWAVPGSIFDPLAEGTLGLLADGASIARGPEDILGSFALGRQLPLPDLLQAPASSPLPPQRTPKGFAGRVFEALPPGTRLSADDLAETLGAGIDRVLTALLELELEGLVRRHPGSLYGR